MEINFYDKVKVTHQWSNIFEEFVNMQLNGKFTDVTLITADAVFHAHKLILASASDYFHTILSDSSTDDDAVIFMKDFPAWIIETIIDFIYRGKIHMKSDQVEQVLEAVSILKIKGLHTSDSIQPMSWNSSRRKTVAPKRLIESDVRSEQIFDSGNFFSVPDNEEELDSVNFSLFDKITHAIRIFTLLKNKIPKNYWDPILEKYRYGSDTQANDDLELDLSAEEIEDHYKKLNLPLFDYSKSHVQTKVVDNAIKKLLDYATADINKCGIPKKAMSLIQEIDFKDLFLNLRRDVEVVQSIDGLISENENRASIGNENFINSSTMSSEFEPTQIRIKEEFEPTPSVSKRRKMEPEFDQTVDLRCDWKYIPDSCSQKENFSFPLNQQEIFVKPLKKRCVPTSTITRPDQASDAVDSPNTDSPENSTPNIRSYDFLPYFLQKYDCL